MRLVVVDAANVATIVSGVMNMQRLKEAIDFFERLGARCIAFAPSYWVHAKEESGYGKPMETDDMTLLRSLILQEKVILTPPQAHDDLYVIDYAVKHDGFIVTNDMFRDHVLHQVFSFISIGVMKMVQIFV